MKMNHTIIRAALYIAIAILFTAASCNRNNSKAGTEDTIETVNSDLAPTTQAETSEENMKKDGGNSDAQISKEKLMQLEMEKQAQDEILQTEGDGVNKNSSTGFDSKHPDSGTTTQPASSGGGQSSIQAGPGATNKDRIIIVGSGGGMTGMVNEFHINKDGRVVKQNTLSGQNSIYKTITTEQLNIVNSMFDQLNLSSVDFDRPGNMYYFVGLKEGMKQHRVTWSSADPALPENIRQFYNMMTTEILKK